MRPTNQMRHIWPMNSYLRMQSMTWSRATPIQQYIEIHSTAARQSHHLAERVEQRVLDSAELNQGTAEVPSELSDDAPLAFESGADGQSLCMHIEWEFDLVQIVCRSYHKDPLFAKILAHPEAHPCFRIQDQLIWTKSQMGRDVVCILHGASLRGRMLVIVILDQAHSTIGHFGQFHTSHYIWRYYWWPLMGTDIELFCSSCPSCQVMKDSNQRPSRLLHSLLIPDRSWQSIRMDFMGPLPMSEGYVYPLVVIDHFMSQVHLIPMTTCVTTKEVA